MIFFQFTSFSFDSKPWADFFFYQVPTTETILAPIEETPCEQNVEYGDVKRGGAITQHWALNG